VRFPSDDPVCLLLLGLFSFLSICCVQVCLEFKCRPRYFAVNDCGVTVLFMCDDTKLPLYTKLKLEQLTIIVKDCSLYWRTFPMFLSQPALKFGTGPCLQPVNIQRHLVKMIGVREPCKWEKGVEETMERRGKDTNNII
jgi:hypothetical protein